MLVVFINVWKINLQTYINMKKYILIIILILLIPFVLYIYFFHNQPIDNPIGWSYFGDFYGGVLTPTITAITTILLAYITITISKRGENFQKEVLFIEYKKRVLNDIMKHQQTLNSVKSKLLVKGILVATKKTNVKNEYDRLDYERKKGISKKDYERQTNDEIVSSLRIFLADIIYDISEIAKYFEYFDINHSLLFDKSNLNKNNFDVINTELSLLYNLLQECLLKGELIIPKKSEIIEKEISKLLILISNTNH